MTTHNIQNIFGLRRHFHAESGGNMHRPFNYGQGFLVRMIRKLQAALANSLQHQLEAYKVRRAIEHVNALNDDQLSDLGITRPDIPRVVKYGKDKLQ